MVEYLDLTIDELLLDEDNPRLGAVGNQSEALEKLIKLNPGHFRTLMLSIKDNGLDPGDNLYIVESDDKGDYVALDGNRRLSAIKTLANPDILEGTDVSTAIKNSLLRAAAGFKREIIEPINCVLFESRADAHDWIYRRHTGAADGEGRINWGSLEIQRFSGDRSTLDVIDFVGRNADYSDEEWASTKSVIESKKSSTLARLLESAAGRKHLGISIEKVSGEKAPVLATDPKWALGVLKRVIEDVRDGIVDSRSLDKASDIQKYFSNLPAAYQPKLSKKKVSPRPFREINLNGGNTKKKATAAETKNKKAATPRPRRSLSPKRHEFKSPTATKGQRLLNEAASIDADKYPISAAFILRAFVEAAIDEYMKTNKLSRVTIGRNGNKAELSLRKCAEAVAKHIEDTGIRPKKDLHGFRSLIVNSSAPASIESLNGFVHNKYQIPTADALRSGWDSAVPVFIAAFGVSDGK